MGNLASGEGTLDAFTSGTIPGPQHNRPAFPFKYYISKERGGGVSDRALILLMQGGDGGLHLREKLLM